MTKCTFSIDMETHWTRGHWIEIAQRAMREKIFWACKVIKGSRRYAKASLYAHNSYLSHCESQLQFTKGEKPPVPSKKKGEECENEMELRDFRHVVQAKNHDGIQWFCWLVRTVGTKFHGAAKKNKRESEHSHFEFLSWCMLQYNSRKGGAATRILRHFYHVVQATFC